VKFIKAVGTFLFIWIIASVLSVIFEMVAYFLGIPWTQGLNGIVLIGLMVLIYCVRHKEGKKEESRA
jgi:hypothetical protein